MNHLEMPTPYLLVPGAPERHRKGRQCEAALSKCATAEQLAESGQEPQRGIVSMFASEVGGVLLCEACRRKCLREDLKPSELTHVELLRPGPKRAGIYLPRLRERRKAKWMKRSDLAAHIGCHIKTLDALENGHRRASLEMANRLAFALAANVRDLAEEEAA